MPLHLLDWTCDGVDHRRVSVPVAYTEIRIGAAGGLCAASQERRNNLVQLFLRRRRRMGFASLYVIFLISVWRRVLKLKKTIHSPVELAARMRYLRCEGRPHYKCIHQIVVSGYANLSANGEQVAPSRIYRIIAKVE